MSDTATQPEAEENASMKLVREKAEKFDESQSALAALQREVAVLRSGIDTDTPLGKFFVDSYTGDPSDTETLLTKAKELNVPLKGESTPAPDVATPPSEPTGTAERQALADSSPADTGENPDPRQAAIDLGKRLIAEGASQDVAQGAAVNFMAQAAMAGDKRVIYEPQQR